MAMTKANECHFAELPQYVVNALAMFIAGDLGSLCEYVTTTPAVLSVLPVVLVLAPGSGAVKSVLQTMHVHINETDTSHGHAVAPWDDMVLEGVSYAVGLYVAAVIWRPVNHRRHVPRARNLDRIQLPERHVFALRM